MTEHPTPPVGGRDDLELLTGSAAGDLLATALATAGGELLTWRVRQVDHRPGHAVTVSYRADVRWADRIQEETLGAATGRHPGGFTLSDGDREVSVWRFPQDPGLPGLAAACDPTTVAGWLTRFGVGAVDPDALALTTRAYRPGRRAVISASVPGGRLYLKVLRPSAAQDVHRRHRVMAAAGLPVPRSLGWTDDGVLVLEALPGVPLRRLLRDGGAAPTGDDVARLVLGLPAALVELPPRRSWTAGARHYADVLGAALPDQAERARQLADVVLAGTRDHPADEPCHGDLYEAQLLLDGRRISGLLDVDGAGPGRRADDLACLVAHLEVLALVWPERADRLVALAARWRRAAEGVVDAGELRLRTAGVLLSLATGPHRVQEDGWAGATRARIDLVERAAAR